MSSSDRSSLNQLPLSLAIQIDAVARVAERTWREGGSKSIEDYLDDIPAEGRAQLLEELMLLEADEFRRRGQTIDANAWRTRFPDHPGIVDAVVRECEGSSDAQAADEPKQAPLPQIRGYAIQRELGRGAMGVVYLARHERLGRLVALKIVAPGINVSQAFNMIRAEAETIARLRHPNIVQVFDVGNDHGVPFLTLEFVDGESLRERLARESIPHREAAEMIEQLARAIHHAHALGVVHRDLKPANILLPRSDDAASDASKSSSTTQVAGPKISDFGLAKLLDAIHEHTLTGSFLGTPKYMSPEQADGRSREVGPLTDVYALGAILFEMLTGRAPFEAESSLRMLQRISVEDVSFPAASKQTVPADLQAICIKCLEKAPVKRYASALELADDIRRYLDDFPVIATRPTRFDLALKFARRNRALVGSALAILVAVLMGVVGTAFFAVRESHAKRIAEETAKAEAAARSRVESLLDVQRENVYWANLRMAEEAWRAGRTQQMQDLLKAIAPQQPGDPDLRGFEWHYLSRLSQPNSIEIRAQTSDGRSAFSPDGRVLATAFGVGPIKLWDAATGNAVAELRGHTASVMDLAFSPSGDRLASAGRDGTVRVWDVASKREQAVLDAKGAAQRSLAFSPDGRRLVAADEVDTVTLWNLDDATPLWAFSRKELYAMDVDFSPDGQQLALGCGPGEVVILNASTGDIAKEFRADHGLWLTSVGFSPDGTRLVTAGGDNGVRVWDVQTLTQLQIMRGHTDWVTSATFTRDGSSIVTSSRDGTAKIWDARTGRCINTLRGHSNWVMNVACSADGRRLATSSLDATVRLWTPRDDWEFRSVPLQPHDATCLAMVNDGRQIAVGSRDGSLSLIDPRTGESVKTVEAHPGFVSSIAASPEGKSFATASHDRRIKIWDAETCEERLTLSGHAAELHCVRFDPKRSQLASSCRDGTIRLWDASTGELLLEKKVADSPINDLAYSPDGRRLATVGPEITQVWDTSSWQRVATLKGHTRLVLAATFSSDSGTLATCGADQTIRIWNVASAEQIQILKGHTGDVTSIKFSRDGRRLVSSSHDGTVRTWDTTSGRELLKLNPHTDWVNDVLLSRDEDFIVSGSNDRTLGLIELQPQTMPAQK